jgi:hypothetical protein
MGQSGLGAGQIEKDPVWIIQMIRLHLKIAVGFNRDARHSTKRPEADSGHVVRLRNVSRDQTAHCQ